MAFGFTIAIEGDGRGYSRALKDAEKQSADFQRKQAAGFEALWNYQKSKLTEKSPAQAGGLVQAGDLKRRAQDYSAVANKTAAAVKEGEKAIRSKTAAVGGLTRQMGALVGAYFGFNAVRSVSSEVMRDSAALVDFSNATGLTVRELAELDFTAKQTGTDLGMLARAMFRLGAARADALGGGKEGEKFSQAFASIGIGADRLRSMTSMRDLLLAVGDAVKAVNGDMDKLPGILDLIGQRNISVLGAMSDGLRENIGLAGGYADKMEKNARVLEAAGDKWAAIWMNTKANLAPLFSWLADRFVDLEVGSGLIGLSFEKAWLKAKHAVFAISDEDFATQMEGIEKAWRDIINRPNRGGAAGGAGQLAALDKLGLGEEAGRQVEAVEKATDKLAQSRRAAALAGMSEEQRRNHLADELLKKQHALALLEEEAERRARDVSTQEDRVRAAETDLRESPEAQRLGKKSPHDRALELVEQLAKARGINFNDQIGALARGENLAETRRGLVAEALGMVEAEMKERDRLTTAIEKERAALAGLTLKRDAAGKAVEGQQVVVQEAQNAVGAVKSQGVRREIRADELRRIGGSRGGTDPAASQWQEARRQLTGIRSTLTRIETNTSNLN